MDLIAPGLRAFVCVARAGTVLAASREMRLTQTAVTLRIQALENALGLPLFSRSRRGMKLTHEGEILLRYCQAVDELSTVALSQLLGSGIKSLVRITIVGSSSTIRHRGIGQTASVAKKYDELLLTFKVADSCDRTEFLRSGAAQIAFVEHGQVSSEMESKVLKPERYVLVGPAKWRHRSLREIILKQRIIDYDSEDPLTLYYLRTFKLEKQARADRHFVNSADGLFQMMLQGLGYSAVTEESARQLVREGDLTVLNSGRAVELPLALAWYPRPSPPAYWKELIACIH